MNSAFDNVDGQRGSTMLIASVFFAFQIYCDFSGYSDIALGTARLFGIELLRNFAYPYFFKGYCRVLETMAHILVKLVPGLCLHTVGWE